MATDPELKRHQEWLGYLQPIGITVAPAALHAAGANLQANIAEIQEGFLRHLEDGRIKDFPTLCREFLGWQREDLVSNPPDLDVRLPEYNETLAPDFAVKGVPEESKWLMLVRLLPNGTAFDEPETKERDHWHASPQARFERLLRETKNPIGLMVNGDALRLIYAPQGESSGHLTFPISAMCQITGRPILAAFHLLFYFDRLFQLSKRERLPSILEESRRYQNQVSTALSKQVLEALHELMAGLHAADVGRNFGLLRDVLQQSAPDVYGGLLTTLMRLVFLLYAEERGLLPGDPVWTRNYSIRHLYARLRDDARLHPDTMDQRYGAWAQLLVVFRIMYDGIQHGTIRIPPRHGKLFDPDAYPFLEGRLWGSRRVVAQVDPPKVSDGVVYRILENLLMLEGERLSYRALDVEQIGSVYEAMMGFEVRKANGYVIALKPDDVCVEIDQILERKGPDRAKFLRETAGSDVTGSALAEARDSQGLLEAIGKKLSPRTHDPLAPGSLYLQPTEERRRSGSHYTPRSLTEPIVEKALEPILKDLGARPTPDQILSLKVCDPAMGSGAFLVAACRLLAQRLLQAWIDHKAMPKIALEDDPLVHAMRLVAQKCLYGVDKNPFAVDLAKLSLWLATMAKDHAFTFLDHALRHGDSLVGLSREQIGSFHWEAQPQKPLMAELIAKAVKKAEDFRAKIRNLAESDDTDQKAKLLHGVESALEQVRLIGDSIVASFFVADSAKERDALRSQHAGLVQDMLSRSKGIEDLKGISMRLREGRKPIQCFHWAIEFPEVFGGPECGFDVIVGNPPFAGKNTTTDANAQGYPEWLKATHAESHGNSDLVAHFFRRAFDLLHSGGTFGLIATKTIGQGDTRSTGLRWICTNGGTIYRAKRRIRWPGAAAVVVSVVHVRKGQTTGPFLLDEKSVPIITAYLFHAGGNEDPARLAANTNKSFQGAIVLGMGFTFDDTDAKGIASSIAEMHRLTKKDPRNKERIFPYIGGEEVTSGPTHSHHRFAINFGDLSEQEARKWPDLMHIVEERVKPVRLEDNRESYRRLWWQYAEKRPALLAGIHGMKRVLATPQTSNTLGFAFLRTGMVYGHTLIVFPFEDTGAFAVLQSRIHQVWALFFAARMKDDARYIPSDCFETFPLPLDVQKNRRLVEIGSAYYESRAKIMVQNNEGLTKTYIRFHDPEDRSGEIKMLRELHASMDRVVLDAYGWKDLIPEYDFIPDFEEEVEEQNRRRKPWRYRWVDRDRDEVLARLLALNKQRAEEEAREGRQVAESSRIGPVGKRKNKGTHDTGQGALF